MIVCEAVFNQEDPNLPGYSRTELDFFAWPYRLSLRKNLITNEFEVYKAEFGNERVLYKSTKLEDALKYANDLAKRELNLDLNDVVCVHSYPRKALWCGVR